MEAVSQHPKRSKPPNKISMPEELVTEILLKLPVESLCKFRSVSKSWLSLISSPDFVKANLLLSASDKDYTHHRVMYIAEPSPDPELKNCSLCSLLCNSVTESFDMDYPGKSYGGFPQIVGSFNGLICLTLRPHDLSPQLFLWNPSTKKYNELPDSGHNMRRRRHGNQPVEFIFGFAYDEFQDDYKVVSICTIYSSGNRHLCRVEAKIYSLKGNSWRRVNDVQGTELLKGPGKLVNRKLHWLEISRDIISIDLVDEKWEELELPSCFKESDRLVLGVVGSDLSVSCNYGQDVWVMKEYGVKESWTKMFTIKSYYTGSMFSSPIFVSNEGEILLGHRTRFTKYNPKDGSIRYLDVPNSILWFEAEIYVMSLVCPFSPKRSGMKRKQQRKVK